MEKPKQNLSNKLPESKNEQVKIKEPNTKLTRAPTRRKKVNKKLVTEDVNEEEKLVKPKSTKIPTTRKKVTKKLVTEASKSEKEVISFKLSFQNYLLQKRTHNNSTGVIAEDNSHRPNNERKRTSKQEQNKKLKKRCVNRISSSDDSSSRPLLESDVERHRILNNDSSSGSLTSPTTGKGKVESNSHKSGIKRKRSLNQSKKNVRSKKAPVNHITSPECLSSNQFSDLYIEKEQVLSDESYDISLTSPTIAKVNLNNTRSSPVLKSKKNSMEDILVTQERRLWTDIEELPKINHDGNMTDEKQNNIVILQNLLLEHATEKIDDLPHPTIETVDLSPTSNSHNANVGKFSYYTFCLIKITHNI